MARKLGGDGPFGRSAGTGRLRYDVQQPSTRWVTTGGSTFGYVNAGTFSRRSYSPSRTVPVIAARSGPTDAGESRPAKDGPTRRRATDEGGTNDPPRRILIEGSGEPATYDLTVTGVLSDDPTVEFDAGDNVSGRNAEGTVRGQTHGFRFNGDLTDLTITGDPRVTVLGGANDPRRDDEFWTIEIESLPDATERTYWFDVDGSIEHVDGRPAHDANGRIAGSLHAGSVRYRYAGTLAHLEVTGPGHLTLAPDGHLD